MLQLDSPFGSEEVGTPLVAPVAPSSPRREAENRELLACAAQIARDFSTPNPRIYWTDLTLTVIISYGSFAGMILSPSAVLSSIFGVISTFGFYRGISFIHELSHLRSGKLRGFRTAWNALIGVPLLTPSFLYDDVHTVHHSRTSYGTTEDPEYLLLGKMRPAALAAFVGASAAAPLALILRFAVLAPLGFCVPSLRRYIVERYSSLSINPRFRRRAPEGPTRREWLRLEACASAWAIALCGLTLSGVISVRATLLGLLIGASVAVVNQIRTVAAHTWSNNSQVAVSLTEQYRDSVDIPGADLFTALMAPVGLRYHATHHLLPSIPYHALGAAHRALRAKPAVSLVAAGTSHSSMLSAVQSFRVPRWDQRDRYAPLPPSDG